MTIQYGDFFSGENCLISPSGDSDLFRFTGSENQIVSLRATDQSGSGVVSICITLFGPDGVPTPAGDEICQNTNAEINEILEASGLHTIRLREAADDTMNYGLAVELLAPPPSPDADMLCFGCDIDAAIDASGDVDLFVFNAQVGDVVLTRATDQSGSGVVSSCITLFGPDGLPTVNGSTECQNTNAEITETIQEDGLHTIVAREADDDTMGYRISLERIAPPSPAAVPICFGCTINESIDGGGDIDLYVFFGTPGDVIIIQATDQSGSGVVSICITLFGPDAMPTTNGGTVCQNTTAEINETIANEGLHAILVREADDDTMNYSVTLQCFAGICLQFDDPGDLSFTMSSYSVSESAGTASVAVRRTGGSDGAVSVRCDTSDGTATAPDDYTATMDTLTWADGDTADKSCTIPITDDSLVEGDETINLSLTNFTGGAVAGSPNTATLTILEIVFQDGFETGDTSAWTSGAPSATSPLESVVLRVLGGEPLECDGFQLAPVVESGSIRLKVPWSEVIHLNLRAANGVVLDRDASARAGEVVEISGLELASYELGIAVEDRSPIAFSIELSAGRPCAALEIDVLAIDGRELAGGDNLFSRLQGTVGEQVTLEVGPDPSGAGSREIVVEPIESEWLLRLWAWIEANRRAVDEASGGRVGYVYLPNTGGAGYTFFNRMFFAQLDKKALILDVRSNGGGQAANYITEVLSRAHLSGWKDRDGLIYNTPAGAVHGPKIMLIDQDAGSGGDYLPWSFRHLGIGALIGTRTWGGSSGSRPTRVSSTADSSPCPSFASSTRRCVGASRTKG